MTALQIFRLIGTEFADVPDDVVEGWIAITEPLISRRVFGKLYEQAVALLVAHRIKQAGYGDSTMGTVGDSLRVGSYSEGETSISFSVNQSSNLMVDADLVLTPYGIQYLSLRRLVVIPIRSAGES